MSGSGREVLPEVREWSGCLLGCPGEVGRPFQNSWSGREASRMSRIGGDAHPDIREWSGGPPGSPRVVGRSSRMSG